MEIKKKAAAGTLESNGYIMGGPGGHSDTAAGAKLTMIVALLTRARLNIVVDKVLCVSTPGELWIY